MADDLTKGGAADRSRINLSEEYEVSYWTAHFGVSHANLARAVHRVGPMVADVERELASASASLAGKARQ